ncbi:hypothetical protein TNIN_243611 [Trichonephila inaurata madagascariensis]|uniref:Uncharacterized protein n=1 Tax=Trichonephila inaurata madagascariensis TaxID=2747483 RepID=A0A8X6ME90_9ARAC|nr:hypothetical protein TNIN_243611 [Trichonephila inaurata madagascariensis]
MQTQWICLRWLQAHNAAQPNIGLEYLLQKRFGPFPFINKHGVLDFIAVVFSPSSFVCMAVSISHPSKMALVDCRRFLNPGRQLSRDKRL